MENYKEVQFLNWRVLIILSVLILSIPKVGKAQFDLCGRDSWAWPGHNHWFLPTWMPNDGSSVIVNQSTGTETKVKQNPYIDQWSTSMGGYQGIAAASKDNGELLFFTNGRKAWKADGTLISDKILQGNECGSIEHGGSAVHGTMIVRHPLAPNSYYIITIDDIVNQGSVSENNQTGSCGNGITIAAIDSSANLVHHSIPIETNITSGNLGEFRTTEGFAATMHGNGVDMWITFQPIFKDYYVSYLLTCDGFVTAPVISGEATAVHSILHGYGDLDFSPDGTKLATSCQVDQGNADNAPLYGYGALNIYDFDNWTGEITNRKAVWKSQWGTIITTNVIFSADGSEVHYSGFSNSGKVPSSGSEASIRGAHTSTPFLNNGFSAAAMNQDGVIEQRSTTNAKFSMAGNHGNELGSNDMYIPPLEDPVITPAGPFCDTVAAVDLETTWRCSGINAEDMVNFKHSYFLLDSNDNSGATHDPNSASIIDEKTGVFNCIAAGPGTHRIVFQYCGVDDTTEIVVESCPACKAVLEDTEPRICAGNEVGLDTLILTATGTRTWTIDSVPTNSGAVDGSLNIGGDTLFNALNDLTRWGTYKLKLQGTYGAETCFDSIYITVDSLPIPVLEDSTICSDWEAVTIGSGAYDSYLWSTGETDPTIDVTVADDYSVTVTDANGCEGDTLMTLTVNDLPTAVLSNDTMICDGDPAITFSAAASTGGSGSNISTYTWENGDNGDSKSTDVDGEYWVAVVDDNGCNDTDTVVLVVNALPVVDLRNDTSICDGDAALTLAPLNPDANDSIYTWSTSDIATSIDVDTAGTYKVVLTDKNGCLDSTEFILTINELPTIELRDSTICGDAPNVVWDAEVATPGMTVYQWANLADLSPAGAGAILDTKTAGEYIVGVVDVNQCVGADTIELIVNNFVPVDLGPDTVICEDADPVVLDAGIANCNWYLWTPDNGTATDEQTYTVNTEAMYKVQLEDENGCSGEDSIYVTVNPLPVVDLGPDTAICFGDPAVVFDAQNAGVGMQYVWGPNSETTQTISVTDALEYTVAIEDVNGCADTDSVVLTVHALPTPDLGVDQEICQAEDSVTFDAGYPTAQSWVWGHGPTTQTIQAHFDPAVTGTSTETYTVTVTDENGCVKDTFTTLTVNPMPIVSIRDSAVCEDAPDVVFDIGASFQTIAWSNGGSSEQESHTAAGVYNVTFTTASGCQGTDTFELVRNPLPTPDLGADQTICADAPVVTFDAGAFAEYAWSPNAESTQTISTKVAGTYEVEVTDANGCKATTDVELVVIPMPTPDVIADYTKCPGANHTFDVAPYDDGFGPYTYAWHDGTTTIADYSTTAAGAVWVDITNAHGCTARDEGSVVDNPSLIVDIAATPDIHLCEGEFATLVPNFKAANGYFFTWSSGGVTASSETIAVSDAGVYDLHVDNGGGCEGDGSIEIFVHPYPVLTPSVAGICDGDPAIIGGDNNLGGTFTYAWNTGETNPTISVTTAGTYIQTVTSDRGCESSETVSVDVYPNPVPNLGPDVEVCDGVPVTIQDNSGIPNLTFAWSSGSTDPTISPTTQGNYSVTVTTPEGCTGSSNMNLSFIPIPTIDAGDDINLCEGESSTINTIISSPGLTVTWNSGENTEDITVNQTFQHIVQVSDNGCTTSDTVDVNVVPLPTSFIDKSLAVDPICFTEDDRGIAVDAGANEAYTYLWSSGETTSNINVEEPGTYIVDISVGNCSITDHIQFTEYCPSTLFIPNAFTPDGDGINDSFNAQGTYITDYQMYIYNRWGELIYTSESMTNDWDGTYFGSECQIDVYVYKIYYTVNHPDGHPRSEQKTGRVTLIR